LNHTSLDDVIHTSEHNTYKILLLLSQGINQTLDEQQINECTASSLTFNKTIIIDATKCESPCSHARQQPRHNMQ
jgi:hypothetical protein